MLKKFAIEFKLTAVKQKNYRFQLFPNSRHALQGEQSERSTPYDASSKTKKLKEKLTELVSTTSLRHSNEISPRFGSQDSLGSRPSSALSRDTKKSIPSASGSRLFSRVDKMEEMTNLTSRPKSTISDDMRPQTASRPHSGKSNYFVSLKAIF